MINTVVLVGRLTKDIELKRTQNDIPVTSFTLAVNRQFKNADGERDADFISCTAWRQTAEILDRFAKKGSQLGVEGSIQTRNYDKDDGTKVYITEVVVSSVMLLDTLEQKETKPTTEVQRKVETVDNVKEDDLPF